jgi:DNA mismatch repair protein MutS
MAGKSTYLRQAALISLMAQTGSFVPAAEARLGLVDRIYCRVGASDNLARGESTFLVEMNETAYILNTATEQSLVIMDEVGRGTATADGLSIAWAVCEELLENIRCRTLFATHYHELSRIEHGRMANRSMDVCEQDGRIIFLRKLRDGPAEKSYGLHVAALAGLSERVLRRAGELLLAFSEEKQKASPPAELSGISQAPLPEGEPAKSQIINKLVKLDLNTISPMKALNLLQNWKETIKEGKVTASKEPSLFD